MTLIYIFAAICLVLSTGCLVLLYMERENRHQFRSEINGRLEAWKSDVIVNVTNLILKSSNEKNDEYASLKTDIDKQNGITESKLSSLESRVGNLEFLYTQLITPCITNITDSSTYELGDITYTDEETTE